MFVFVRLFVCFIVLLFVRLFVCFVSVHGKEIRISVPLSIWLRRKHLLAFLASHVRVYHRNTNRFKLLEGQTCWTSLLLKRGQELELQYQRREEGGGGVRVEIGRWIPERGEIQGEPEKNSLQKKNF